MSWSQQKISQQILNPIEYKEKLIFFLSLKILFGNWNAVNLYNKINIAVLVLGLCENTVGA